MKKQNVKTNNKNYFVMVLCIFLAVVFLAFTIYEAVTLVNTLSEESARTFVNIVSMAILLIYGLTATVVSVLGAVLSGEKSVNINTIILSVLCIAFAIATLIITVSYIISDFAAGDVITVLANITMVVTFGILLVTKKIRKYLLAVPAATVVLHLYNMFFVYPGASSSTTAYYIWSIFMVAFAALVAVYLFTEKKLYLYLGMGVFAFNNMFRMLLTIGSTSNAGTVLAAFVQYFGDILFIMCVILFINLAKRESK